MLYSKEVDEWGIRSNNEMGWEKQKVGGDVVKGTVCVLGLNYILIDINWFLFISDAYASFQFDFMIYAFYLHNTEPSSNASNADDPKI